MQPLSPACSPACSLADNALLSALIDADATDLLRDVGGLGGIGRVSTSHLIDLGLDEVQATRVHAALELGRRVILRSRSARLTMSTPEAVADYFAAKLGCLDHEEMWVVAVDGRSRLKGMRRVSQGGRHELVVSSREVLTAALAEAASGFFLVHNHPSGSPKPSAEDIEMTHAIEAAADVVGVPLIDHVIVTATEGFASLMELGWLASSVPPNRAARRRPSA